MFFRFAAEIQSIANGFLPIDDIKGYDELVDLADNFDPTSGIFIVGNSNDDSGVYILLYNGTKTANSKVEPINVYDNDDLVIMFYEEDAMVKLTLGKGDKVYLKCWQANTIPIGEHKAFFFTGWKI